METIKIEKSGKVALIGLNRPAKRNAFNMQMLRELAEAYTEYERDAEARCAVVYALGDHFTAGLDLAEVGPAVAEGATVFPPGLIDPFDLAHPRRSKPIVTAAQGFCFTAGVELCLASDVNVASSDAVFSQMEVCRGIMPFGGATLRFARSVGWQNAMLHLLSGDRFDAAEALRIGLVQFVVEPGRHLEKAVEIALKIAEAAPLAVTAARRNSLIAIEKGFDAAFDKMYGEARALMASEDAVEGMMSFMERRKADFKGK